MVILNDGGFLLLDAGFKHLTYSELHERQSVKLIAWTMELSAESYMMQDQI